MEIVYVILLFMLSLAYCSIVYRKLSDADTGSRIAAALLPLQLCVFAVICFSLWMSMPSIPWNAARLSVSMAFMKGYNLYSPIHEGPIISLIAGPVAPIVYIPATLASTPTGAILFAGLICMGLVLLPLLASCWISLPDVRRSPVGALYGFLFAASAIILFSDFFGVLVFIHTDQTALGFGLLSCLALLKAMHGPRKHLMLATAATMVVLAVWSKQIAVMLIPAQFVYLLLSSERRLLLHYFAWLTAIGVAVSLSFLMIFG